MDDREFDKCTCFVTNGKYCTLRDMEASFDKEDRLSIFKMATKNILRSNVVFPIDELSEQEKIKSLHIATYAQMLLDRLNGASTIFYDDFIDRLLFEYELLKSKIRES